ncbi:hypothetical protein VM1G_03736 [Cytospora mali]|uniref:Uncharacterized protein n=1 Tax=Cytospora mali TaxID=578113 RepID=A0A194VWN8_CYTMA|nr:hypothetical protein VM1G_03736 [Valsa mali]
MSSTKEASSKSSADGKPSAPTASNVPTLPPNVSIFSPTDPGASNALLNGLFFTRLAVSAQTEPAQLAAALKESPKVSEAFCLSHQNAILVFDGETDGGDVKDAHHEHVRAVCLALKDADMSLSIAGCVFDAEEVLKAGFQLDALSRGAVMVVDLMTDDDDSDDDDDDDEDAEAFLMGGAAGGVVS